MNRRLTISVLGPCDARQSHGREKMLASFTRRLLSVHPLLLAMAPILLLGSVNSDELEFWVLALPLAISVAAAVGVWGAQAAIRRDWQKGAIITSLLIAFFFTYGHLTALIDNVGLISSTSIKRALVLVPGLAVLVGAEIMLRRVSRDNARRFSHCIGFAALMLCAISSVRLFDAWLKRERPVEMASAATLHLAHRPATLPDIYYIVLDGYARNDTLQEYYELDNSTFTNSLKEQGFFVADGSYSNYPVTRWSLASSLNMRFVHKEGQATKQGNEIANALLRNNEVGRVLKAQGYQYVHFNTHYPGTYRCDLADESFPKTLPQFYNILADTTMLRWLWKPKTVDVRPPHILLFQFEKLKEIPENRAPTFTVAHIICPHVPYWFDRHGNFTSDGFGDDTWDNVEEYREQLLFVNQKIREAIDTIVAKSDSPPIIIVQADHGTVGPTESLPLEYQPKRVQYRHGILFAVQAPSECTQQLYSTISPVNTFRVILNGLFKANLPLHEDRVFTVYPGTPEFIEVTDFLRLNNQASKVADKDTSTDRR